MDKDIFTLNNKTYSNNNNILNGIINELQQIVNSSHEDLTIKRISDVIIKMNFIINENKKNHESIINQFTILQNKFDQLNQKMNINNINNQKELKGINDGHNWRYVGQVVNGLREGKGICYWDVGDRYEGDFRNDKAEGKGIYYWNIEPFKGDIYEGDCRNDKQEGKGIYYFILKMVIYMKVILKMVNKKEKELFIIMMAIDMKVIIEMVKEKEKEFIIIIMVIGKWVIIMVIIK